MARVHLSTFAARKGATLRCDRCKSDIVKGQKYRWFAPGFRSAKRIRCMRSECSPRPSELDSSYMSGVLAAIEEVEDTLASIAPDPESGWDQQMSDLNEQRDIVTSAIEEVAGQYRDAAESMGGAGYQMEEWADNLEQSEVMDWDADSEAEPGSCDDHDEMDVECMACVEVYESAFRDAVESLSSAIASVSKE